MKTKKIYTHCIYLLLLLVSLSMQSCEKLLEIPEPINAITDKAAFSADETAIALLSGLYVKMAQPELGGFTAAEFNSNMTISASLSADDLFLVTGVTSPYFLNNLINNIGIGGTSWPVLYNYVYRCNAALEGLFASETLSAAVRQQLLGEAYFIRAYVYFHLVNLFGPVPLAKTTDYTVNTLLYRSPVDEVYQFIAEDLRQAEEMLSANFLNGSINTVTTERVRPTKWAARALLARVYLYAKNYEIAAAWASAVIDQSSLFSLPTLENAFLKNNPEAIWQLQPVQAFWNTEEAKMFVISESGFGSVIHYLNPSLMDSFEDGDQRSARWVGKSVIDGITYPYAHKYKVNTFNPDITNTNPGAIGLMAEYSTQFRLAEQYLIRAEARAYLGDLSGAIQDVDRIRQRAGLPLLEATRPDISQAALLDAILQERRVELFTEGCHRWFDLKRTGRVDAVMSVETPKKGGVWESREALYPLQRSELERAKNLTQNPGYPGL